MYRYRKYDFDMMIIGLKYAMSKGDPLQILSCIYAV
jgi:hypothetical protein